MVVAGFGALLLLVVLAVPYVVIGKLGVGTVRRVASKDSIALTFDDGPDPAHTPAILDTLAAHGARATFFVVGSVAEQHPELVARIRRDGHELGSHSYTHRHAVFHRAPLTGWSDTRRGIAAVERIAGPVRWFRPPWGGYSWSVFAGIRSRGLRAASWSIEARDWHPESAPSDVERRVLGATPGDIICLHDSGRGAAKTQVALDAILRGLARRGLAAKTLSEMAP